MQLCEIFELKLQLLASAAVKHTRSCQPLPASVLPLVQLSRCDLSSQIPHRSQDLSDSDMPSAAGLDKYINVSHVEAFKMLLSGSV